MSRMMQAVVVEAFGKPLSVREWPIPSVGSGQILIKTGTCGVCRAAPGDWSVKLMPPFIPGHEAIVVVDFGAAT